MRKIYQYNEQLYTADNEYSMYLLGLVASDGCIDGYHIKISLQEDDMKLLEQIRDSIAPGKPLYRDKRNGQYILKITNIAIRKFVESAGITKGKSRTLELSQWVIESSNFNHFLRGYFDGDGTVVTEKYRSEPYKMPVVKIVSASYKSLDGLYSGVERLGLKRNKIYEDRPGVYLMKYCRNSAKKLYDIMYSDATIYLSRKQEKLQTLIEQLLR